jgi:TRAP-type C4-dicarboxylate transport system permease small subunit
MMDRLLWSVRGVLSVVRALSVILLAASVLLNFGNIVSRFFLHASFAWAEEAMLFLMVGCVFLGSASVTWSGRHIRMDAFVRLLPDKMRELLALFSELLFVVTAISLVAFAWPTIRQLVAFDQRSLAADIPLAIPQGVIPIGLVLMAFLVICRLITGRWRHQQHTPGHEGPG